MRREYYLVELEPAWCSWDDVERWDQGVWGGLDNLARSEEVRRVHKGDLVVVCHDGEERRAVGIAEVASSPYPDPLAEDDEAFIFDLKPRRRLKVPVSLDELEADPAFRGSALPRRRRGSVVRLDARQWKMICDRGSGRGGDAD